MIGLLRFVGLMNVAIWLGAAVFLAFAVEPASGSGSMLGLLGQNNFPWFSVAIGQLFEARYSWLHVICGAVALLHLGAEWLYFGRQPRRWWLGLLLGLFLVGLIDLAWLQPRLVRLHRLQHSRPDLRLTVTRSFTFWHRVAQGFHLISIAGLTIYFWRVANPPDPTRFLSTNKFRY